MNLESSKPLPRGATGSRRDRAILALLQHSTLEKASEAVGVHAVTLWRWSRKPEFQQALLKARQEAFSQSIARLQQSANMAVGTLLRIMTDSNAPTGSRVRAADCVLSRSEKGLLLEDLRMRIEQLEQREARGG
jgi:hypothetical protein